LPAPFWPLATAVSAPIDRLRREFL